MVIDALFGTGLVAAARGALRPGGGGDQRAAGARAWRSTCRAASPAAEPQPIGPHVEAALTVTFAAPKVAHVFPPAADAVGEMVVTDLGIPPRLVDDVEEEAGDLHLLMGEELADLIPEREAGSHKGDYGHALIVAGSPGKAGACILAARAAVRAGAGLVTAAVPEPILQTVDLGSIESMTLALPAERLRPSRRARGGRRAGGGRGEGRAGAGAGAGAGAVHGGGDPPHRARVPAAAGARRRRSQRLRRPRPATSPAAGRRRS